MYLFFESLHCNSYTVKTVAVIIHCGTLFSALIKDPNQNRQLLSVPFT